MLVGHLAVRNGHLCFAHTHTATLEPKRYTNFWPLRKADWYDSAWEWQHAICDTGVVSSGQNSWYLPTGTEAIHTEIEDVPAPKTRLPVKWHYGEWRKLTARKGWVRA